jgi:hypothetical protein
MIDDGASTTRTRSATLALTASDPSPGTGVALMRIANTQSDLASAAWESYATRRAWTVTAVKGTKTVFAQYKDGAGNVSAVAQDSITLK